MARKLQKTGSDARGDHYLSSQEHIRQYYEKYHRAQPRSGKVGRLRSNLRGMDIQPGDHILDVGCGQGANGSFITSQGAIPFGIDISLEATRVSLYRYAWVLQANAESLPFSDTSFDGATFMGTLEHFVDPSRALCEAYRTLRAHAQICFVVPNKHFFLFKLFGGTGQPHEEARSYEGWYTLFESEGLTIEKVYRDVGPGVFEGGLIRGLPRKLVLLLFNSLPLHWTYQFVFICSKNPVTSTRKPV